MKLLFLMLSMPPEDKGGGMYVDLAEEFVRNGHDVTVMAPDVNHKDCFLSKERGMRVIRVASKETQGIHNMVKKGIALATLEPYYKKGYKKYLQKESFDWIIMPTPPITLSGFAAYVKRRTGARFYLILRDIHPQSVWSIGVLHNKLEYHFLDKKARMGYSSANLIGCMSQGNIDFIHQQYPGMKMGKCVILYNWVNGAPSLDVDTSVRMKYSLEGKFVALFGGNLGKGQRIENISYLAEYYRNDTDIIFLVIARGVEKNRLVRIAEEKQLDNIKFVDFMPQADYLNVVRSVDLGLVSINENYAVPTCPSKAVSYMSMGIPVLAMINPGSDYGDVIENAGAGYWSVGSDKMRTTAMFDKIYSSRELRQSMSKAGKTFYEENCTPQVAYSAMFEQMNGLDLKNNK